MSSAWKLPLLGKISCRQKLQKKETKRGGLALHDIINTTVIICKPCMIPRLQRRHSAVILLRLRLKTSESLGRNIRSMCALGTSGCLHKISPGMCLPICWRSKLAKVCFAAGALQPPGCWSFSRLFQEGGCTVRPSWAGACSRLLPLLCHDPAHASHRHSSNDVWNIFRPTQNLPQFARRSSQFLQSGTCPSPPDGIKRLPLIAALSLQ